MGAEGNEKMDEVAKEVAERPDRRRCLERFMSLTHVSNKVTERK